ncbi:MAG: UDP-glucose 4-epimerase GalE [Bacteroidia bacterium]
MTKTILVTGGLGFIGSHTVVELIQSGYTPIIIDNLSNSLLTVIDGIEKITGIRPKFYNTNVLDTAELVNILKENNIEAVIHFAALKSVVESVAKPLEYYHNNVGGLISVLNAMKATGVQKIVFSSSCTVYGQPDDLPVNEDSPVQKAESPYGNTKKMCEDILVDLSKNKEIRSISLRYFNPAGAHPTSLIGELPIGVPYYLVPYITQTAAGWREQLTVHGSDYDTPDGTCVRDYLHVVDLAIAHIKALEYLDLTNLNNDIFNLGTGRGCTVLEVINAFEEATSQKLNYKIGGRRPGDVEKVWSDCTKANKLLEWKAEADIKKMMLDAWNWQKTLIKP